MMNQAEKRKLKKEATNRVQEVFEMEGFVVAGQTKQGVAVQKVDSVDWFVIQVITKDPSKHDIEDLLEEKREYDAEQEQKRKEKEAKKAEK